MVKAGENTRLYDLEERMACFGEAVIGFAKRIPQNIINDPMISQLVRSATSVGANYHEANNCVSKKDFRNKIGTCKKEAGETRCWLRLICSSNQELELQVKELEQEAKELNLIFGKIFRSSSG